MHASEIAWQPLTPGGVAAFARARPLHLLALQLVVSLLAAGTVLWFLGTAWFPVITSAIQQLPPGGSIRFRKLIWPAEPAVLLAENHFLAVAVDLQHEGQVRSPAHVQVEFGAADVRVYSLLGLVQVPYPEGWRVALNRAEAQPWWGAWSPALLGLTALAVIAWLFLNWCLLAALYSPIAWLTGFFADRDLSLRGAWRLSGAALMPGAFLLIVAIILYGMGVLDVVRLLAAGAIHFVVGWVYVLAAPFWCPRHPAASATAGNPFVAGNINPGSPSGQTQGEAPTENKPPPTKPTG